MFHVRGNFYMDRFTFLIMSKGVILLSGSEVMDASLRTFAISVSFDSILLLLIGFETTVLNILLQQVSPEMAPAATIMVYHVSKYMEVVADSLTFPVNGISRNNVR